MGKAALASYVIVPAIAFGLLVAFQADPYVAAGFLIAAVCPGAPYGPPLTGIARGNVPLAVGLMVILAGSSALVAPLLLQLLIPWVLAYLPPLPASSPPLAIDGRRILTTLIVGQFVPLCAALAVRWWKPEWAAWLKRPADRLSMILNVLTLGLILYSQFDMLIGVPLRGYAGMLILVLASASTGWLLARPGARTAMVMATSVRNVGVGLVIVTATFAGTRAVAAATAFAIFQTLLMVFIALMWGRLASRKAADSQA